MAKIIKAVSRAIPFNKFREIKESWAVGFVAQGGHALEGAGKDESARPPEKEGSLGVFYIHSLRTLKNIV